MPYRTPGSDKDVRELRGAGGTRGGTGMFLVGLAMLIGGGFLFLDNVVVQSSYAELWGWGRGTFGLSLIPLMIGVGWLFFNGKSIFAWLLTGGGLIIIVAGVVSRLIVYYRPMSLFNTLLIFVLIAGGIGLIARSVRDMGRSD